MGALHEGHAALLRAGRAHAERLVMSLFVNPLQFSPDEDFDAYPRDEARDLAVAETEGVDVVFAPGSEEMYPPGAATTVSVGRLGEIVEGAVRPGHFVGVASVVAKLFNLVQPDTAFFGQKDAQQVAVLRRMGRDLHFPVQIEVCPTVRAADGLAISSRNAYLSPEQRAEAPALFRALRAGEELVRRGGEPADAELAVASSIHAAPGLALDYALAVDPDTFEAPEPGGALLLVAAARLGRTRLIDNIPVPAGEGHP
jgi:pantoate--beta-alanine ligase